VGRGGPAALQDVVDDVGRTGELGWSRRAQTQNVRSISSSRVLRSLAARRFRRRTCCRTSCGPAGSVCTSRPNTISTWRARASQSFATMSIAGRLDHRPEGEACPARARSRRRRRAQCPLRLANLYTAFLPHPVVVLIMKWQRGAGSPARASLLTRRDELRLLLPESSPMASV
jgi:hypothetical protein